MKIDYREAAVGDADAIATVEVVSQQFGYRGFLPAAHLDGMSQPDRARGWRDALEPGDSDRTVVATHEEKVVGFVRAGKFKEAGFGWIPYLFVLPEYWSLGVGRALMRRATDIMRDFGVVSAQLYAYRDNARGRRFYEHLGWKPDGRTYDHEFDGQIFPLWCYVRTIEANREE